MGWRLFRENALQSLRWSENGIFSRMLLKLADQSGGTDTLMIDATHMKAHRTASSLGLKKGGLAA